MGMQAYKLKFDNKFKSILKPSDKIPWTEFVTEDNKELCPPEALDFLDKLLQYDHHKRPTVKEAMRLPYLKGVRAASLEREKKNSAGRSSSSGSSSVKEKKEQIPLN